MKKSLTIGLLLVTTIAFVLTACGPRIGGHVRGRTTKSGMWVDNNTFRIVGIGAYNENVANPLQKKRMAMEAAEIDAQYRVLQKFKGAKLVGASGMKNFQLTGTAAAKEVGGFIRGGSVIKETCGQHGCEIVYEVKAQGLKNRVKAAFGQNQ